jgi:hypothetical protein
MRRALYGIICRSVVEFGWCGVSVWSLSRDKRQEVQGCSLWAPLLSTAFTGGLHVKVVVPAVCASHLTTV